MVKAIRLEELEIYQLAMEIGDEVWKIVLKWDAFSKRTVGAQFITAVDYQSRPTLQKVMVDTFIKRENNSVIIVAVR